MADVIEWGETCRSMSAWLFQAVMVVSFMPEVSYETVGTKSVQVWIYVLIVDGFYPHTI